MSTRRKREDGVGWNGADYRPFSPPRAAVLYSDGKSYDVLVTCYRRGRWQITLPEDARPVVTASHGQRRFFLRPGKTVTVPADMIEFVGEAPDPFPDPLPDPICDPLPGAGADP